MVENNDRSEKALFYISGTANGEFDPNIPNEYMQTPPVTLGGTGPGFDALLVSDNISMALKCRILLTWLQFQYLALIRFGTKMHGHFVRVENALRRWEERKPEIVRSLSSIAPLREYGSRKYLPYIVC